MLRLDVDKSNALILEFDKSSWHWVTTQYTCSFSQKQVCNCKEWSHRSVPSVLSHQIFEAHSLSGTWGKVKCIWFLIGYGLAVSWCKNSSWDITSVLHLCNLAAARIWCVTRNLPMLGSNWHAISIWLNNLCLNIRLYNFTQWHVWFDVHTRFPLIESSLNLLELAIWRMFSAPSNVLSSSFLCETGDRGWEDNTISFIIANLI